VPPQSGPVDYSVPNSPFSTGNAPFTPKPKSNASMIVGLALVAFGAFFLLDNFDLLPNWEFDRLWPVVFIAIGALLLFSRREVKPWVKEWNATTEPVTETKTDDKTEDTPPTE